MIQTLGWLSDRLRVVWSHQSEERSTPVNPVIARCTANKRREYGVGHHLAPAGSRRPALFSRLTSDNGLCTRYLELELEKLDTKRVLQKRAKFLGAPVESGSAARSRLAITIVSDPVRPGPTYCIAAAAASSGGHLLRSADRRPLRRAAAQAWQVRHRDVDHAGGSLQGESSLEIDCPDCNFLGPNPL
ncbi:hypothetical protein J6590_077445 [Homalodisca vitripennis]|nr:hypothetical protein J6590_077445 [Homalodisca vitripennis]